jgi:predicted MFS family arabinose efflux permease
MTEPAHNDAAAVLKPLPDLVHPGEPAQTGSVSSAYKRYALVLLTAVYGVNLIDRGLISLLLEPIRLDLGLSDTQAGLMTGIAFGLFYVVAGLPLSRWADRGDRSLIAAGSIGLWGLTMMGFVLVGNFVQLLIGRIIVAVGEAGCKPPTYSMVGDYFPGKLERTRAMSIYWLSNPLAALIGFVAGGWLNEHFGWRMTFFIVGIPGLLLAVLVWFTLKEPRREMRARVTSPRATPPMLYAFQVMWRQPTARNLMFAMILFYMLGHGMQPWYAAFLIRSHGMNTGELGLWLGFTQGGAGIIGILLGGYIATRWLAGDERAQLRVTGFMVASLVPLLAGFLFLGEKVQALAMLMPYMLVLYFFFAPTFALFQRLVPDEVRATTLAIVMTLVHLISMGIGPQVVGILSDVLVPTFGKDSLRYAMLIVSFVAVLAGYQFWKAGRTVARDLNEVERAAGTSTDFSAR